MGGEAGLDADGEGCRVLTVYVFGALGMILLLAVILGVHGYRDGRVSADLSWRGVAIETGSGGCPAQEREY